MNILEKIKTKKWIPYITYILIGINVVIFLIEELYGGSENIETALSFGAFFTPYIILNGELYRLVASMFLHFGAEHLGANMISLCALGPYVEHYFGHLYFLILYFFSGICGNLATMFYEYLTGSFNISAGASGAVFGLLSVFLLFAFNKRLRRVFPVRRVMLSILLSMASGLMDTSVNFIAHLGGFTGGLILSLIMQEIIRFNIRHGGKQK